MADELTISSSIRFVKGTAPNTLTISRSSASQRVTVSGMTGIQNVVSIGTSDEELSLGDIGTIGYCWFKNLDATNYLTIGPDGASYPIKLKAGETAGPLRWNGAAIHALANTGACVLEYILVPD